MLWHWMLGGGATSLRSLTCVVALDVGGRGN